MNDEEGIEDTDLTDQPQSHVPLATNSEASEENCFVNTTFLASRSLTSARFEFSVRSKRELRSYQSLEIGDSDGE